MRNLRSRVFTRAGKHRVNIGHVYVLRIDASFSCVCLVIDHEFRHNIRQSNDSLVEPQTTLTTLKRNQVIVSNRTDVLKCVCALIDNEKISQ